MPHATHVSFTIKRGIELSKDSSIESLNNGGSVSFGGLSRFSIVVALIWLIGFSLWFQSFGFANNSGVYRWMFWINLPYDLLDLVDPPSEAGKAAWSWFFLLERVPFLLVALATWTGGWGIGRSYFEGFAHELRGAE